MTQYLLAEQVLFLHSRLIEETGGAHGMRYLGMLLSALVHPQATFDNQELYPDLFTKTAVLMDSLVHNHPFVKGNKRTSIAAAGIFLRINHCQLVVENEEMVRFTLACAQSQLSIGEMTNWYIRYSLRETVSNQPETVKSSGICFSIQERQMPESGVLTSVNDLIAIEDLAA